MDEEQLLVQWSPDSSCAMRKGSDGDAATRVYGEGERLKVTGCRSECRGAFVGVSRVLSSGEGLPESRECANNAL